MDVQLMVDNGALGPGALDSPKDPQKWRPGLLRLAAIDYLRSAIPGTTWLCLIKTASFVPFNGELLSNSKKVTLPPWFRKKTPKTVKTIKTRMVLDTSLMDCLGNISPFSQNNYHRRSQKFNLEKQDVKLRSGAVFEPTQPIPECVISKRFRVYWHRGIQAPKMTQGNSWRFFWGAREGVVSGKSIILYGHLNEMPGSQDKW